jgi:hypothetical protein
MVQQQTLLKIIEALEVLQIPYMMVWITSAEDIILSRLMWYKASPVLDRQLQDVLEVYEIQEPSLDQGYLERWAAQLGVSDLLATIRAQAARPPATPAM